MQQDADNTSAWLRNRNRYLLGLFVLLLIAIALEWSTGCFWTLMSESRPDGHGGIIEHHGGLGRFGLFCPFLALWPSSITFSNYGSVLFCSGAAAGALVHLGIAVWAYLRRSLAWTLLFGVLVCTSAVVMWIKLALFFGAIAAMKGGG